MVVGAAFGSVLLGGRGDPGNGLSFAHVSAVQLAQEDVSDSDSQAEDIRQHPTRSRVAAIAAVCGVVLLACALVSGVMTKRSSDELEQRLDVLRSVIARGEAAGLPPHVLAPAREAIAQGAPSHAEMINPFPGGLMRVEPCLDNEEEFENLCYMKCGILSNGKLPYRTAANTCCETMAPCANPHTYKTLGLGCNGYGIGGDSGCPHVPVLECANNEEMYPAESGACYMKCDILTNHSLPIRAGPATCKGTEEGSEWTHGAPCDKGGFDVNGRFGCPGIPWA